MRNREVIEPVKAIIKAAWNLNGRQGIAGRGRGRRGR